MSATSSGVAPSPSSSKRSGTPSSSARRPADRRPLRDATSDINAAEGSGDNAAEISTSVPEDSFPNGRVVIDRRGFDEIDDDLVASGDENEDYFHGAALRLDRDEREAEEEGEDLMADDADGNFVFGERDDLREREAFQRKGIDPDAYDDSLLADDDEADELLDDPKARRAAERHMTARDRANNDTKKRRFGTKGRDMWAELIQRDDNEDDMERVMERVRGRRHNLFSGAAESAQVDLQDVEEAKKLLGEGNARRVQVDERHQQAVDTLFKYFLYNFSPSQMHVDELAGGGEGGGDDGHDKNAMEDDEPAGGRGEKGRGGNKSNNQFWYLNRLRKMILEDRSNLQIDTRHLLFFSDRLIHWLECHPSQVLRVLDDALTFEAKSQAPELYASRVCHVVFYDWPYSKELRDLRCHDINTLVSVAGVVTKRSGVLPKLRELYLSCYACGFALNDVPIYFSEEKKPDMPTRCQQCHSSNFVVDRIKTAYTDFQRLTLQEAPGRVPAGRAPRQRDVIVVGELVDKVKPGEEVEVLGTYKPRYEIGLNIKLGFPIMATEIAANNIVRKEDVQFGELTEEDTKEIRALSKDPHIRDRIIASIAPSLWGHKDVKTALAYALFGGVAKGRLQTASSGATEGPAPKLQGGHSIRGDINILLLGDPGLGKSQALQYVAKTFARTVSTTGKGASAVGLTAGVKRDPRSGEWTLEGGALVLADEGICLIDEFDKMTDKDRVSIHEAMEQQSISISKAGIVTTLRARCAVIAAANPRFGRYIPSYTFKENVDLSDPILSRFDLIAVLRDVPSVDDDHYLAEYVITNHQLSHPTLSHLEDYQTRVEQLEELMTGSQAYEPIPQDLLKKYIVYARTKCRPSLEEVQHSGIKDKLTTFYSRIRQRAASSGGFPMTLRHVESIVRIAEANAKMRLARRVSTVDVDYAIATMLDSYISSQKFAVASRLVRDFARYRALARGGDAVLLEIAGRAIQQRLQRHRLRSSGVGERGKRSSVVPDGGGEGEAQTTADSAAAGSDGLSLGASGDLLLLPVEDLKKLAKQNKFSDYHVDNWMKSPAFSHRFCLVQDENGVDCIASAHWSGLATGRQSRNSTQKRHV